jgi:hypothetical protein
MRAMARHGGGALAPVQGATGLHVGSFPVVGREKTDVAADYGGMASAVALPNGKGGETGNERAVLSIARSVVNTQKQADCGVCGPA